MFGGAVKLVSGTGAYKLVVSWLDSEGEVVGTSNQWSPPNGLNGWIQREFDAPSPPNAAFARMQLGAGQNQATRYFMSDLYLIKETRPQVNLLGNGNFGQGPNGWVLVASSGPTERPEIIVPSPLT